MKSNWFDVDREGLAAIMQRKGKSWAIFELIANALDAGAKTIRVLLAPVEGRPLATLEVEDDSTRGWDNLDDAFTMFARSASAEHATRRGRFNLGEKLVLSLATEATIGTMNGTVFFDRTGRTTSGVKRNAGTKFTAVVKMTRDELDQAIEDVRRIIIPVDVILFVNNVIVPRSISLATFEAKLPTEIANGEGVIQRTTRQTMIEAHRTGDDQGEVLEMGIPVAKIDGPWRLNVLQKVPMNFERDAITDGFRRALLVAAVNHLHQFVPDDQVREGWIQDVAGDARIHPTAMKSIIVKRFGDRAVVATVGDPLANAQAEAAGYTVIHGGSFTANAWANIAKFDTVISSAKVFPSPKPEDVASKRQEVDLSKYVLGLIAGWWRDGGASLSPDATLGEDDRPIRTLVEQATGIRRE